MAPLGWSAAPWTTDDPNGDQDRRRIRQAVLAGASGVAVALAAAGIALTLQRKRQA